MRNATIKSKSSIFSIEHILSSALTREECNTCQIYYNVITKQPPLNPPPPIINHHHHFNNSHRNRQNQIQILLRLLLRRHPNRHLLRPSMVSLVLRRRMSPPGPNMLRQHSLRCPHHRQHCRANLFPLVTSSIQYCRG